jgi:hypothetical protein
LWFPYGARVSPSNPRRSSAKQFYRTGRHPATSNEVSTVNAIHNILNILSVVVGSLVTFDWAGLGLDPATAATIAGVVLMANNIIKIGMNIFRDGVGGLFGYQPPVVK